MRETSKFRFVFTRASTYRPNVVFCCWWGGAPPPNLQFVVWGSFHPSHYANLGGLGLTRGPLKGAVRGAGADQRPSEGGSLPCCLCPSGPGGGARAKGRGRWRKRWLICDAARASAREGGPRTVETRAAGGRKLMERAGMRTSVYGAERAGRMRNAAHSRISSSRRVRRGKPRGGGTERDYC